MAVKRAAPLSLRSVILIECNRTMCGPRCTLRLFADFHIQVVGLGSRPAWLS